MRKTKEQPDLQRYAECRLCPRDCGVNRLAGSRGICGESAVCRVAHWGPHWGEEPCFSGRAGSGTIFFTGCSSRCFFCQNYQISQEGLGHPLEPDRLLGCVRELVKMGVHNINFVTPDHFWPHIAWLCSRLREEGETIPFLFNTSGYQKPELVAEYAEWIDIFMPDFKFADPELARICMGDPQYPVIALKSLQIMVDKKGFLHPFDPSGNTTARVGVLVRHLVLPGHVENSIRVLQLLRREFGRFLPLSLMSQYRPVPRCKNRGQLLRRITREEFDQVCEEVHRLEFENVFVQPDLPGDEFFPDFRQKEPFAGNRARLWAQNNRLGAQPRGGGPEQTSSG